MFFPIRDVLTRQNTIGVLCRGLLVGLEEDPQRDTAGSLHPAY